MRSGKIDLCAGGGKLNSQKFPFLRSGKVLGCLGLVFLNCMSIVGVLGVCHDDLTLVFSRMLGSTLVYIVIVLSVSVFTLRVVILKWLHDEWEEMAQLQFSLYRVPNRASVQNVYNELNCLLGHGPFLLKQDVAMLCELLANFDLITQKLEKEDRECNCVMHRVDGSNLDVKIEPVDGERDTYMFNITE